MTTPGSEPLDLSQLDRNFRAEEFTAEDFQSMVERIEWLEKEASAVSKLVEALEWYADRNNWAYTPCDHDGQFRSYTTIKNDLEMLSGESGGIDYAGKRARAALEKYKGMGEVRP